METKAVNRPMRKKDAMALVTGQPVYTDDLAPKECLIVKLLRSPHPHALVEEIDISKALKVAGVEAVFTYKDVPDIRFTNAGQTYPEASPYDRLILDRRVRYVGDPVAIIAAETEEAAERAMRLIKVKYEVLEPVLDPRTAKDGPILVHPEDNWQSLCPVGADNKRNLCSSEASEGGDVEKAFAESDVVIERTYHTKANQQAMMETFRTYAYTDIYGRLTVVSATQITFHVRRIVATALGIPKSKVRVIKPRIGGGFGAKQTAVSEVYPAFVTYKTGKPSKIVFTREEAQTASSPRHEMYLDVKIGAMKNGKIKAIELHTLSNTGAYGEHGPTTVGLSGHKAIPIYSKAEAFRFTADVVYTNVMAAGAYRGYGATQGIFAIESAIDELSHILNIDPALLREMNITREGDFMPAYYGETANSCALDRCLARVKEMIGWESKYPRRIMENGNIRAVGLALALQGSCISGLDVASVAIKVNDDGFYSLMIGASDMGTGCDTILAQMAADCLLCEPENIVVYGVDTDVSPYDSGSYASSTTYITGNAVVKTCASLIEKIKEYGAKKMGCNPKEVDFDGKRVYKTATDESITLKDLANFAMNFSDTALYASEMHTSPVSPPPYMAGAVEIELDRETGKIEVINYKACVDCGTVINPNLARVQTEGGIAQGIGMALYEDISYNKAGVMRNNSFMQYKLPTRQDIGTVEVTFESSYEPTGPFGAKSIGEIVINTPSPAIANALDNAVGVRIRELPLSPEKVYMEMIKNED